MWATARLPPASIFGDEESTSEEDEETIQTTPGWSAYNALLIPERKISTVIGYCPMINGSPTEFSTIYTVRKKCQSICTVLGQDNAIRFDLTIDCKAKQIQCKF